MLNLRAWCTSHPVRMENSHMDQLFEEEKKIANNNDNKYLNERWICNGIDKL